MGDFGQLPRALVCVFGPPEYTGGRMVARLRGPEEDASCWPRKLSTLWWPMIEAGSMLRCLLVEKKHFLQAYKVNYSTRQELALAQLQNTLNLFKRGKRFTY